MTLDALANRHRDLLYTLEAFEGHPRRIIMDIDAQGAVRYLSEIGAPSPVWREACKRARKEREAEG